MICAKNTFLPLRASISASLIQPWGKGGNRFQRNQTRTRRFRHAQEWSPNGTTNYQPYCNIRIQNPTSWNMGPPDQKYPPRKVDNHQLVNTTPRNILRPIWMHLGATFAKLYLGKLKTPDQKLISPSVETTIINRGVGQNASKIIQTARMNAGGMCYVVTQNVRIVINKRDIPIVTPNTKDPTPIRVQMAHI